MTYLGNDWGDVVVMDFIETFCGSLLGQGAFRRVYAHGHDPRLVVKIELGARDFSNVTEWDMWTNFQRSPLAKWLAPCRHISPSGSVLIQDRVGPLGVVTLPRKVPAVFADLKVNNWGVLKGRVVCHDYGNHHVFSLTRTGRMRVAKWSTTEKGPA